MKLEVKVLDSTSVDGGVRLGFSIPRYSEAVEILKVRGSEGLQISQSTESCTVFIYGAAARKRPWLLWWVGHTGSGGHTTSYNGVCLARGDGTYAAWAAHGQQLMLNRDDLGPDLPRVAQIRQEDDWHRRGYAHPSLMAFGITLVDGQEAHNECPVAVL